jgi:hypothetical protein
LSNQFNPSAAAIALAEIIAESTSLTRVDVRDNPDIKSAGLLALHLAIKMNTTMTVLNIDSTCCITNAKVGLIYIFFF